jgi:hypothetical protein
MAKGMVVTRMRTIAREHYSVVKKNNKSHPKGEEYNRRRTIRKR